MIRDRIVNPGLQTPDAAPAELFRVTVPPLSVFKFRLEVLAVSVAGVAACFVVEVAGKRAAGAFSIVGAAAPQLTGKDAGAVTWTIQPSANNNDLVLSAVGQAATVINWAGELEYMIFTP